MSNSDFEYLDPGTCFDCLEIKSGDELQDLADHILVLEHDRGR